jgi:septum formation protein
MIVDAPIILASSSPRRRELLSQAGIPFTIHVSGCDETPIVGEGPKEMVERLALLKAAAVAESHRNALVIGADTTVFIDDEILGKPESEADARRMLSRIAGRVHRVWGGIAVIHRASGIEVCTSHVTSVKMCPMTEETISWYVSTGEPMDKAGSYAIQGIGLQFVDSIEGSYSNVVGLDIAALRETLTKLGVKVSSRP